MSRYVDADKIEETIKDLIQKYQNDYEREKFIYSPSEMLTYGRENLLAIFNKMEAFKKALEIIQKTPAVKLTDQETIIVSEKDYNDVINFILPRYKLNEFIYIGAVSRGCLVSCGSALDRNIVAIVLSNLADKKALEEIWLIRCPYCSRINTDIIYVHYEVVPHWFTCPHCDMKIKTGKNDFVDYAEPVYKLVEGIDLNKFRKEKKE